MEIVVWMHTAEEASVGIGLAVSAIMWVTKNCAADVLDAYFDFTEHLDSQRRRRAVPTVPIKEGLK